MVMSRAEVSCASVCVCKSNATPHASDKDVTLGPPAYLKQTNRCYDREERRSG